MSHLGRCCEFDTAKCRKQFCSCTNTVVKKQLYCLYKVECTLLHSVILYMVKILNIFHFVWFMKETELCNTRRKFISLLYTIWNIWRILLLENTKVDNWRNTYISIIETSYAYLTFMYSLLIISVNNASSLLPRVEPLVDTSTVYLTFSPSHI